jgi:uroporphyrinogen decarboxylase
VSATRAGAAPAETLFDRACRGERGERTPVWIMRQAGRYLPEYRRLREDVDFLTATKTPEIAARITLQPMERFPLDAAIIFSDIMTPLEWMGVEIRFAPGPVIDQPVRTPEAARALRQLEEGQHPDFVEEAIRLVRAELSPDRSVIGFAGAPFTLFCYLVEGGGSKDFMEARSFLNREPDAAMHMLDVLGASMARYLAAQARAGASAVMLFDSWAGLLDAADYRRFALPVLREAVAEIRRTVDRPILYFAKGTAALLEAVAEVGADVYGIDWRLPLSNAVKRLGGDAVVQGNLDPAALFAPPGETGSIARRIRTRSRGSSIGSARHRNGAPGPTDRVISVGGRVVPVGDWPARLPPSWTDQSSAADVRAVPESLRSVRVAASWTMARNFGTYARVSAGRRPASSRSQ